MGLPVMKEMRRRGIRDLKNHHDNQRFVELLKDCVTSNDLQKGTTLHGEIARKGLLEKNPYIASALITMYAKCGSLLKARKVLEELSIQDIVSWNALIGGYAQRGQGHEALNCFEKMQKEGLSPNEVTFTCILKACGNTKAIEKGKQIHEEIVCRDMLEKNVVIGNALVDMYAKCGMLKKARQVLEELPIRNIISWSALIAGYAQEGQGHEALNCFEQMQREGFRPDWITFISILKACGSIGAIDKGRQIHNEIARRDLLKKNSVNLGNALVNMYVECGLLRSAQEALGELHVRDSLTWSTLIAGYARDRQGHEALKCFEEMKNEGYTPTEVTFISILKSCGDIGAFDEGKHVHDEIVSRGLLKNNLVLATALVDMYAKCGALVTAKQVLEQIPFRDIVSWSALISGYAEQGQGQEALTCFWQMRKDGISPNEVTFLCILKACSNIGALDEGKRIHDEIIDRGLLKDNIVLGNALVDMYAKCGALTQAQEVLDNLPNRNIVTWNALIAGYAQQGQGHEALNSYEKMQRENLAPNEVTFTCMLKACGSIGAINKGREIHDQIIDEGLLGKTIVLGNALVDMYAKCGALAKAKQVLEELPVQDTISWSSLIAGYAHEGHSHEALNCFDQMQKECHQPSEITLLCVLNACSRAGKFDEAQMYYENMNTRYGIRPKLEHHTCMVAVYGSSGCFDKAISVIKTIPSPVDPTVWIALLDACRKWGNVRLGMLAFDQALQLDPNRAGAYVLMASIYAGAGMQEDAEKVEALRVKFCSPEEVGNKHVGG